MKPVKWPLLILENNIPRTQLHNYIGGRSGSHKSKKYASRTGQQLAHIIHVLKLHYNTHLAPIRLFFNVTTRASRTRSNSYPTAARTFFIMNSLKKYASRTTQHVAPPQRLAPYSLTLQPARLALAVARILFSQ